MLQFVGQAKQTLAAVGPPKQKFGAQVIALVAEQVATLVPQAVQGPVPENPSLHSVQAVLSAAQVLHPATVQATHVVVAPVPTFPNPDSQVTVLAPAASVLQKAILALVVA